MVTFNKIKSKKGIAISLGKFDSCRGSNHKKKKKKEISFFLSSLDEHIINTKPKNSGHIDV